MRCRRTRRCHPDFCRTRRCRRYRCQYRACVLGRGQWREHIRARSACRRYIPTYPRSGVRSDAVAAHNSRLGGESEIQRSYKAATASLRVAVDISARRRSFPAIRLIHCRARRPRPSLRKTSLYASGRDRAARICCIRPPASARVHGGTSRFDRLCVRAVQPAGRTDPWRGSIARTRHAHCPESAQRGIYRRRRGL